MQKRIIECVPNFSEGKNAAVIQQIANSISSVEGVKLLDVDPGKATNRTVMTFVGEPELVIEAAFLAIKTASELIDMSGHKGEHPRMGATDVCPLIPISGISMEETALYAKKLAERVGVELQIPVYLYEEAQTNKERSNLSVIRAGEYEGFFEKIKLPEWKPDFGPQIFSAKSGATVIGARDFLIAYNVNLNTTSTRIANRIAFDVREAGRVKRDGNPISGKIVVDENGEPIRIPGKLKHVKAIGWYIEEYKRAQISMNLTNYKATPLHLAFAETEKSAMERGVRVTGSELVGLIPLQAMLDAGKYFLEKQGVSAGVSEAELVKSAILSLGLNELGEFDPTQKIIEYKLKNSTDEKLIQLSIRDFCAETASESPAPGGGSVAALCGSLAASLGSMVANLSANKKGWETRVAEFSKWAEMGQTINQKLLYLIDEDTRAFTKIMDSFALPKDTEEQKKERKQAIQIASKYALAVPLSTMKTASEMIPLLQEMEEKGNQNSLSDVGVAAACFKTALRGAWLNVLINAQSIDDKEFTEQKIAEAKEILSIGFKIADEILNKIEKKLGY